MRTLEKDITEFQGTMSKLCQLSNPELYIEKDNTQEYKYFVAYYKAVPNFFTFKGIDVSKFWGWFMVNHQQKIREIQHSDWGVLEDLEIPERVTVFLEDPILLVADATDELVKVLYRTTDFAFIRELKEALESDKFEKIDENSVYLMVSRGERTKLQSIEIKRNTLDLLLNYNDDFIPIHKIIEQRLGIYQDKGLVLLHGKPGTGKTSYIRYLISTLKKQVIFISPQMAGNLTSPSMLELLSQNQNSVLVIEDAEELILDRNRNKDSTLSGILNLTDGLLADCLNIQVICTFNTEISKIDSALLRKGRLIACYEFKELSAEKANALSQELGHFPVFDAPTLLTEVYNQDDFEFKAELGKKIGF